VKHHATQESLFEYESNTTFLPSNYTPVRPDYFAVSQIYLAKGSLSAPERQQFVRRICNFYPLARVYECLDKPHNRIKLNASDLLSLHKAGKTTLVFGELANSVRYSREEGNTCPNYWHFSPYGFCPYGCKYCYLAGTEGVKYSPTVKIYVNLIEMLHEIDHISRRFTKPTAFYIGKLQDALALDPLTAYSTVIIPFFAVHPNARLTLLTKSNNVDRLVDLEHRGHSILSWSVNPPEVCRIFEENVPHIEDRIEAMRRVSQAGYPVRAVMMPVIPIEDCRVFILILRRTLSGECHCKG